MNFNNYITESKIKLQPKVIDYNKMRNEYDGFAIGDKVRDLIYGNKGIIDDLSFNEEPDLYGNYNKIVSIKLKNGKLIDMDINHVEHI